MHPVISHLPLIKTTSEFTKNFYNCDFEIIYFLSFFCCWFFLNCFSYKVHHENKKSWTEGQAIIVNMARRTGVIFYMAKEEINKTKPFFFFSWKKMEWIFVLNSDWTKWAVSYLLILLDILGYTVCSYVLCNRNTRDATVAKRLKTNKQWNL